MPLNLFYTMVQKSQKWPKTQIKGGSCLNSLEVWQRALRMTGDTDAAKSSKLFFPSFFLFFSCFLIFLEKAFSERKIALENFPKKDEGTLQTTVHDQSMTVTNVAFETVVQVRKAIFPFWPPTKKSL